MENKELKIYLKLKATCDFDDSWKKGDECEITNYVFSKDNGIAFWPIDKGWEIIEMRILEYKEITQ